ncbi:MAG TPA: hypothetical protein VIJ99_08645 [Acidimicrobiales bacterium]
MPYVIALVVILILVGGATLMRRRGSQRHFDYAPKPQPSMSNVVNVNQIEVEPVATPGFATEDIIQRETHMDVTDDLLDPHNPGHAQWVKDRPDMETDQEWVADHPDTPDTETT